MCDNSGSVSVSALWAPKWAALKQRVPNGSNVTVERQEKLGD